MARGYSKTIICGHVGDEPEIRATSTGKPVAVFSVAVTDVWNDKESGERKERTQWFRTTAYGRTAELARDYVHKGSLVLVEAEYRSEKYVDKEQVDRYSSEFVVRDLKFLDRAPTGSTADELPAVERAADEG